MGIEILHGSWQEPQYSPDEKGYFYEERGWIYLHLEGSGYDRGYQHGWLLADYIQLNIRNSKNLLADLYALDWEYLRVNAERMWGGAAGQEMADELTGIVDGASERGAFFDYLDLLVLNGLEELQFGWFPTVQEEYYRELSQGLWNPEVTTTGVRLSDAAPAGSAGPAVGVEPAEDTETANGMALEAEAAQGIYEANGANSAVFSPNSVFAKQAVAFMATGSATEDGGIVMAHNTIAFYPEASLANVLIDLVPWAGQRITMQAEPGRVSSFGEVYANKRLLIANTRIQGSNVYNETSVPEFLRIRHAVQYSETLDEFAEEMLNNNSGNLASTWLVGELKTDEIMKLELGFSFNSEERITDGYLISSGDVDDVRIRNAETDNSTLPDARQGTSSRSLRLADLIESYEGELTPEDAQAIMADHYDSYLSRVSASSRSVCAHYDQDDARYAGSIQILPNLPFGTIDAKVTSTELIKERTFWARWGSACGRAFDSQGFIKQNPQYQLLCNYLYDRPSQFWNRFYPLDF